MRAGRSDGISFGSWFRARLERPESLQLRQIPAYGCPAFASHQCHPNLSPPAADMSSIRACEKKSGSRSEIMSQRAPSSRPTELAPWDRPGSMADLNAGRSLYSGRRETGPVDGMTRRWTGWFEIRAMVSRRISYSRCELPHIPLTVS